LTSPSFEISDETGRIVLVIPIPEPRRLSKCPSEKELSDISRLCISVCD
jgi:hypothetical protein